MEHFSFFCFMRVKILDSGHNVCITNKKFQKEKFEVFSD